jgi:Uma2 family endonuclease
MVVHAIPSPPPSGGIEILRLRATRRDLSATPIDEYRYELLKGVLFRMPPPKPYHGAVCMRVARRLIPYCEAQGWLDRLTDNAGFDFTSSGPDETVLAPDLAVAADPPGGPDAAYSTAPPILAVEVASPSESRQYLTDKAAFYLAAGVQLVWILWPDTHTVEAWSGANQVRALSVQETLDGGTVLPGFSCPVADLFP